MKLGKSVRRQMGNRGFSLIEILIVMAIFVLVIAGVTSMFGNFLGLAKDESKRGELSLEKLVGVDVLIQDVQNAGMGLPYTFGSAVINYAEVAASNPNAAAFNDAPNGVPASIRGTTVLFGDRNVSYLVLKGSSIGMNDASQRLSKVLAGGQLANCATCPDPIPGAENELTIAGDNIVVLNMIADPTNYEKDYRRLIMSGGSFSHMQPANTSIAAAYAPTFSYTLPSGEVIPAMAMAYGINSEGALRMPFNRADYFISAGPGIVPGTCAPGTGVLTKNIVRHDNGQFTTVPLIDCVASFHVFYGMSAQTSPDSKVVAVHTDSLTVATMTTEDIRRRLREVRVFILMHEGKRDQDFTFVSSDACGSSCIRVGTDAMFVNYILTAEQLNYRWKVVSFTVQPRNL